MTEIETYPLAKALKDELDSAGFAIISKELFMSKIDEIARLRAELDELKASHPSGEPARAEAEPVAWLSTAPNHHGLWRERPDLGDGFDVQPLYAAPPSRQAWPTREEIVQQHVGWLKQYVGAMSATNWRDMQAYAERQLAELSLALTNPPAPVESADIDALTGTADDQRNWAQLDDSIRETECCLDEIARRRAVESAETDKPAA